MYRLLIKKINQTAKHQQHKRHGLLRALAKTSTRDATPPPSSRGMSPQAKDVAIHGDDERRGLPRFPLQGLYTLSLFLQKSRQGLAKASHAFSLAKTANETPSSLRGMEPQRNDAAIHEDTTDVDCFVVTRKDEDGGRRLREHLRRLREE